MMRFFHQDEGAKVSTKCIRVSSTATTLDVLNTLVEKFRPDMRMLSLPEYSLYEVHVNGGESSVCVCVSAHVMCAIVGAASANAIQLCQSVPVLCVCVCVCVCVYQTDSSSSVSVRPCSMLLPKISGNLVNDSSSCNVANLHSVNGTSVSGQLWFHSLSRFAQLEILGSV